MKRPFHSSFLIFLLYRLSSVFIIQTWYVPDEYWQSLEVAHRMAFGYGYLTWEWSHGLRSYLYPFVFALFYKTLEFLRLDFAPLIILVPRLFQAFLTAVSDKCFFDLCKTLGFQDYWAKVAIFTNWFWYYCGSRTITNTFETSLTIMALSYYPWNSLTRKTKENKGSFEATTKNNSLKYLTIVAVSCIVRPTAVTVWGHFVLYQLLFLFPKFIKYFILTCVLPVSLITLSVSIAIDWFWYGRFIIPAYNFLTFNVYQGISSFYGTHPSHWYITQGLPVVLGLHYFPFIFGSVSYLKEQLTKTSNRYNKIFGLLLFTVVLNTIILSNIPHKEFRFVLPLTPFMMLIAVKFSSQFFTPSRRTYKILWTSLLALGFIVPSLLFGVLHQRGPLSLTEYLRNAASDCHSKCLFLYLMPCHSTPLYSHLHINVSTRFLTCDPPLEKGHYDESEHFFNNPNEWLSNNWNDENPPSHVTFFDSLEGSVKSFLKSKNFKKRSEFLHTIFPGEESRRYILVYEPF